MFSKAATSEAFASAIQRTLQREQGLTYCRTAPGPVNSPVPLLPALAAPLQPLLWMVMLCQVSSAHAGLPPPASTMLGLKRFMGSSASPAPDRRVFRSTRFSCRQVASTAHTPCLHDIGTMLLLVATHVLNIQ
jgi:hypothetical protein